MNCATLIVLRYKMPNNQVFKVEEMRHLLIDLSIIKQLGKEMEIRKGCNIVQIYCLVRHYTKHVNYQ